MEPGREAGDELLRSVAGSAGHAGVRQRLQDPVGALHPPRGGERALSLDAARRRQRRAAGRSSAAKLERASLGRRAVAANLGRAMALSLQLPSAGGKLSPYTLRGTTPIKPAQAVR